MPKLTQQKWAPKPCLMRLLSLTTGALFFALPLLFETGL